MSLKWPRLGASPWLAAVCLSGLASCAVVPKAPPSSPALAPGNVATIFVDRRGWHIDVAFAATELAPPLASLRQDFPEARYLTFGFGDRRYLMARASRSVDLIAAVWPGAGLILVTALEVTPQEAFGSDEVVALPVTRAQALAAEAFIWQSISKRGGHAVAVAGGPYAGSAYYAATPRYSGLRTCNTWAAATLRAAGLPVHVRGVIWAGQLWRQVRRRDADPAAAR